LIRSRYALDETSSATEKRQTQPPAESRKSGKANLFGGLWYYFIASLPVQAFALYLNYYGIFGLRQREDKYLNRTETSHEDFKNNLTAIHYETPFEKEFIPKLQISSCRAMAKTYSYICCLSDKGLAGVAASNSYGLYDRPCRRE
jgi:hypothetical protein